MIAIDTNLLVYAYREDSAFHSDAMEHLHPVIEGDNPWALPWPCVHEFIGVVTNGRVYKPASPLSQALGFLDSLMTSPQLHLISESPGYFKKLRELALAAKLSGPRIHDARIAARFFDIPATQDSQPAGAEMKGPHRFQAPSTTVRDSIILF
jgi:predicted nucleic acid-binding protein